jgi:hypothetical protein
VIDLSDLDVLVPVYNELDWLDSIIPILREIQNLGGNVIIGLNFRHPEKILTQHQNSGFTFISQREILSREEHWTKILNSGESKFVRYWFAGDQIHLDSLKMQLKVLRENPEYSFAFSERAIKTPYGQIPFEKQRRMNYWAKKGYTIGVTEFLESILETGTNYVGEPSFVTFNRNKVPAKWEEGFGYAVELDFYHKALENGIGVYVPGSAGFFGVGASSASAALVDEQEFHVSNWIRSKRTTSEADLRKVHYANLKRVVFFKILKFVDNLFRTLTHRRFS